LSAVAPTAMIAIRRVGCQSVEVGYIGSQLPLDAERRAARATASDLSPSSPGRRADPRHASRRGRRGFRGRNGLPARVAIALRVLVAQRDRPAGCLSHVVPGDQRAFGAVDFARRALRADGEAVVDLGHDVPRNSMRLIAASSIPAIARPQLWAIVTTRRGPCPLMKQSRSVSWTRRSSIAPAPAPVVCSGFFPPSLSLPQSDSRDAANLV